MCAASAARFFYFHFERNYIMSSCAFFGNSKDKDMSLITLKVVYQVLEHLVEENGVKLFYTTSRTDFDSVCETAVEVLKRKYHDIQLIKIAKTKDEAQSEDPAYDDVLYFRGKNFRQRYMLTSKLAKYIVVDTDIPRGDRDTLFDDILYVNRNRMDEVEILILERLVEKRKRELKRKRPIKVKKRVDPQV